MGDVYTKTKSEKMKIDQISKFVGLIAGMLTIFWVSYNIRKEFKILEDAKIAGSKITGSKIDKGE